MTKPMTFPTDLTLARLAAIGLTTYKLGLSAIPQADSDLTFLSLVATRLIPVMPRFDFSSLEEALEAISSHVDYHKSVSLVVNAKTDRALNLYMLTRAQALRSQGSDGGLVNPWASTEA